MMAPTIVGRKRKWVHRSRMLCSQMFRCGTRLKIPLPTPLADGLLPAPPRPQGALAEAELPGKGREISIFPVLAQQVQRVGLQAGHIAPPLM